MMKNPILPHRRRRRRLRHRPTDPAFCDEGFLDQPLEDGSVSWDGDWMESGFSPLVEVGETEDEYFISLELPGMDEDEVDIHLAGDRIVVSGERKPEPETQRRHFHRREFEYGAFERSFDLPRNVRKEPEAVTATFDRGILMLRVKLTKPQSRRAIRVSRT